MRQRRAALLRALGEEKQLAFQQAHRGVIAEVLFEGDRGDGRARGLTENFLRAEVVTDDAGALHNTFAPVRLLHPGAAAM